MNLKALLIFSILCLQNLEFSNAQEPDKKPTVFLMKLDAEIDPRTNRYSELALEKALEINADYVIIEMDTYGGALNDADDIRTRVMEFEKPIYVFINKDAASAGALISIACDSIYMAKGASIGAATVVTGDGTAAPDKYQSYMRSIMRSTAEASGRDPKIAEAMVDENLQVDSVSQAGKVITFTSSEAIENGYCEGIVSNIEEIMNRSNIQEYELYEYELSSSDRIIAIFLNPFVSGILILVILGGVYFELQTPGIGFPILAAVTAMVLYFVPHYLNGLAENWEIILFFIGILLIVLEIFVIPGFGVAGIAGISLTITGLILVMVNNDNFDFSFVAEGDLITAIFTTFIGLIGAFILMFIGGVRITESRMFKKVALQNVMSKKEGYTSDFKQVSYLGKQGKAYTILRPSGKVIIDENILDASTRGDYIEKDSLIEVVGEEGTSLKVKSI
jgi:membrane-bound serine protease (ClpP class)